MHHLLRLISPCHMLMSTFWMAQLIAVRNPYNFTCSHLSQDKYWKLSWYFHYTLHCPSSSHLSQDDHWRLCHGIYITHCIAHQKYHFLQILLPLWHVLNDQYHGHAQSSPTTDLCGTFSMIDGHAKPRRSRCKTVFDKPLKAMTALEHVHNKFPSNKPRGNGKEYCMVSRKFSKHLAILNLVYHSVHKLLWYNRQVHEMFFNSTLIQ